MAKVFFSYSHTDEKLRDRLEISLVMLKRQGQIEAFHDRRIPPGDEMDGSISDKLEQAEVILLLVSPEFLASNYCYDIEMQRAIERHERREARVIPVILRPCDWKHAPFSKLMATPPDGKPATQFADLDLAFQEITDSIRKALQGSALLPEVPTGRQPGPPPVIKATSAGPRSSNLRLPQSFTDVDKDRFRDEAFDYIA